MLVALVALAGQADAQNAAPSTTGPSSFSVLEGSTPVATLTATDAEGDALGWRLADSPGADAGVFVLSDSGELAFAEAPDHENALDANSDGVYEVRVAVSDDTNTTTRDLRVTVTDVAPALTGPRTASHSEGKRGMRIATFGAMDHAVTEGDTMHLTVTVNRACGGNGTIEVPLMLADGSTASGTDVGFNPLASLPALESLNLDGSVLDLGPLASLQGLRRLSVRHNLLDDLQALAALTGLTELDIGDNRIEDLNPLAGLVQLEVLRADRNGIADLWPLASLTDLEVLELGANRISDAQPLAGLERLEVLRLAGNGLSELHPLSGLKELADLGLASTAVEDVKAIAGLEGLRRLDLRGNSVGGLSVAGREDRAPPIAGGGREER